MAAEKGRAFLLKVGDGATAEVFATLGGLRSTGLTINNEEVDITDKGSAGWRELLADAGTRNVTLSGSGVFKDTAAETLAMQYALAASINNFEAVFEDASKFSGAFFISSLEFTGEHNGAKQYSISLSSSGVVTYA